MELDADGYADLFDTEVKRILDIHAPLRTGRRGCGQHDSRHLSDEARQVKQQRRRLERRYRRTGLQSDKEAYLSACSTARESILKSRAADIKSELDKAAGDVGATWRTAETVAQPTQGRVRRRPVRTTSLNILPVLRRQGEMHPRQHLGGTAVISPSHVRRPSTPRTTAVYIRASDR